MDNGNSLSVRGLTVFARVDGGVQVDLFSFQYRKDVLGLMSVGVCIVDFVAHLIVVSL